MDRATASSSSVPGDTEDFLRKSIRAESDRAKQWLLLKPTVMRLLAREGRNRKSHAEIVIILKEQYDFNAFGVHQLKYQLKVWNAGTSLPARVKKVICKAVQRRKAKLNKSSIAIYKGRKVDPRNLQRWLHQEEANSNANLRPAGNETQNNNRPISGQELQLGHKVFMNLNLPIGVLRSLMMMHPDYASPASVAMSPMDGVIVETPKCTENRPSPRDAQSPMAVVAKMMSAGERAFLFIEGRHLDLLRSMSAREQWTTASWAYELWQYFFKTAKHWGRGPVEWTANNLGLECLHDRAMISSANSPNFNGRGQSHHEVPEVITMSPTTLCNWSIHTGEYSGPVQNKTPWSPPLTTNPDLTNEANWTEWPTSLHTRSYTEVIQLGLETNSFSRTKLQDLPVGFNQIVKAVKRSPNELLEEAFGFSIMGRNFDLVTKMLEKIRESKHEINLERLHPFHLATTYLDGSKQCCNILDALVGYYPRLISVRKLYLNGLGHTILDNLMITILRSHTSCSASTVDEAFTKSHRFAGEDVDICGRWDADSECIRQLLANGNLAIPFEWKHMFCHTSAQVICHSISALFGPHWGPDINSPSGLFTRRCSNPDCGEKLILYPLHTLVLTAIHLSESGCRGENLFGVLACLLCLLSNGANPLLTAQISPEALLGRQLTENCTHEALDPLELASRVPESLTSKWSHEIKTGWRVFCYVLRESRAQWCPKAASHNLDARTMNNLDNIYPMHPASLSALPSIYGIGDENLYDDILMGEASFFADDQGNPNEQSNTSDMRMHDAQESECSDDEGAARGNLPMKCTVIDWHSDNFNYFGKSKRLAPLWAAVQTELVTYRRLEEGDSWISPFFNMQTILGDFENCNGEHISIDLVIEGMMSEFCDCGVFIKAQDHACVRMEEASSYYFSNLENCNWARREYIFAHEGRPEDWLQEKKGVC